MAQYCSDSDTDSYDGEEYSAVDDEVHSLVYFGRPSLAGGGAEEEEEDELYEIVGEADYQFSHRFYAKVCQLRWWDQGK